MVNLLGECTSELRFQAIYRFSIQISAGSLVIKGKLLRQNYQICPFHSRSGLKVTMRVSWSSSSLTLLRSQKILTILVFWGLFRPQTFTDPPTIKCPKGLITFLNVWSPVTNLNALRGLKRPQKTVVRLKLVVRSMSLFSENERGAKVQ